MKNVAKSPSPEDKLLEAVFGKGNIPAHFVKPYVGKNYAKKVKEFNPAASFRFMC